MNPFVPILVVAAYPFVPILVVAARVDVKFLAKSPDFPFDVSVFNICDDSEPAEPEAGGWDGPKIPKVKITRDQSS